MNLLAWIEKRKTKVRQQKAAKVTADTKRLLEFMKALTSDRPLSLPLATEESLAGVLDQEDQSQGRESGSSLATSNCSNPSDQAHS